MKGVGGYFFPEGVAAEKRMYSSTAALSTRPCDADHNLNCCFFFKDKLKIEEILRMNNKYGKSV